MFLTIYDIHPLPKEADQEVMRLARKHGLFTEEDWSRTEVGCCPFQPQQLLAFAADVRTTALGVGVVCEAPSDVQCEWTESDPWGPEPQTYDSACGEKWSFIDGGAKENGVKFCHNCGKPVKVIPFPVPADDEDADGVEPSRGGKS